jgi:hypothetical protein
MNKASASFLVMIYKHTCHRANDGNILHNIKNKNKTNKKLSKDNTLHGSRRGNT